MSSRVRMEHPGRVATVVVLAAVAVVLVAIAITSADTDAPEESLPTVVESVSPRPDTIVQPQTPITLDLRDDLTVYGLRLRYANGQLVEIPLDELELVPSLGQYTFRPGPGTAVTRYEPGVVVVDLTYASQAEPSRPIGTYSWRFVSKS